MEPAHSDEQDKSWVATASGAAGSVLSGVFAAAARVRPTRKPLHPRGEVLGGTIHRNGLEPRVGVRWIDEPGTDDVQVRLSRAIGLPSGWPDIFGLAIRVPTGPDSHGDVLFATTGRTVPGRFVLFPGRTPTARTYSTLIPYRTDSGPLLLAAQPDREGTFTLACAGPAGSWRTFGLLRLEAIPTGDLGDVDDVGPSFDPVLNQIPGLAYYPWAARIREGSYRAARRSRAERDT
jgi:hypothetical protein